MDTRRARFFSFASLYSSGLLSSGNDRFTTALEVMGDIRGEGEWERGAREERREKGREKERSTLDYCIRGKLGQVVRQNHLPSLPLRHVGLLAPWRCQQPHQGQRNHAHERNKREKREARAEKKERNGITRNVGSHC